MQPDSWSKIRRLFERALELPEGERAAFVERASDHDDGERREVLRLLAHADSTEGFLEAPELPPGGAAGGRLWQPRSGDTIGGYRLEESLGSGGMGTVFAAHQERPSRRVALKVLHASSFTGDARRRFEFEAEVLGRLRHPGIAVIHELGVHESPEGGEVPWFAMEHVEGARDLVTYAREEGLDVRARVERLREVCAAVQYAHQKGVIHRDLKPANVLVDAGGRTKVIDFGVARVSGPGLERGPATMTGYVLGTFGYMAPEQLNASSSDVDTRADVYALGVLLYELLTGRLPHETRDRPLAEAIAGIVTRAPEPPSRHAPGLPSELDWVALEALEIEPERRYASAAALADDLGRFLRKEPVLAGRPTRRYRLGKFVARNKALVSAGVVAVVALVAGSVTSTLAMLHAEERRVEAEEARKDEAAQARAAQRALRRQNAVVESLREIFGAVEPDEDGRLVTLFELLERQRPTLDVEFSDDPELRGSLQGFLASAYDALGLYQEGQELLASAVETLRTVPEFEPAQLAWLEVLRARGLSEGGRHAEAWQLLRRALPVIRSAEDLDPSTRVYAERIQASYLANLGDLGAASEALRDALELGRELLGPDDAQTLQIQSLLATRLAELKAFEEAVELARGSWERARATTDEGHPLRLFAAVGLADVLTLRGDDQEVAVLQREVLDECRVVHGDLHRNTIYAHEKLARALATIGAGEQAVEQAQRAIELSREHHSGDADRNMRARLALADVLELGGDPEGCARELEAAVGILDGAGLGSHNAFVELSWRLARGDLDAERPEDAEARMRDLLARLLRSSGNESRKMAVTRALLGLALVAQLRDDEADAELSAACNGVAGLWGAGELAMLRAFVFETLVEACEAQGHAAASARLEKDRDAAR